VTSTDPQVAAGGLTETQAIEQGIQCRTVQVRLEDVAAAIAGEGVTGTAQLVVDESRQVIVGATFTGPDADTLHGATAAIVGEVPAEQLRHVPHPVRGVAGADPGPSR